jgi:hypothetical protein
MRVRRAAPRSSCRPPGPTDHLATDVVEDLRWFDVDTRAGAECPAVHAGRLAHRGHVLVYCAAVHPNHWPVHRDDPRDPSFFVSSVDSREGSVSGSAPFAYKLNWQSVSCVDHGDDRRQLSNERHVELLDRQPFVKGRTHFNAKRTLNASDLGRSCKSVAGGIYLSISVRAWLVSSGLFPRAIP